MTVPTTTPPLYERLIWIVVACLAWRFAGLASSVGIYRAGAAGVAIVVLATAFGLAALTVAVSRRAQRWAAGPHLFLAFTFFFVVFGIVDSFTRAHTAYSWSTDAHAFGDYAARLLLRGHNPYDTSLAGAFSVSRLPIELQTPLADGGFSDRTAYPSLSFLVLVPFVKLGIDTRFAFAAAVWGCTAVAYFNVPRAARPLVLVPFFADPMYLYFAFGGVTDGVWALLLCFVVIHWSKRDRAALLFGLACCLKQHPWLLAPFLALRLWQEIDGPPRAKLGVLARFFGIAGAVFLVTNLPFIAWNARAWIDGVVEPLVRRMVPLGDGPTAFVALVGAPVPRAIFAAAFWGSLVLLFIACSRLRAGRVLAWIAPSLAFLLNHRSLSTYWYFNVFPFVVELARADWSAILAERDDEKFLRRLAVGAGAFIAALVVCAFAFGRARADGLEVTIDLPMRTYSGRLHRVDLHVTNRSPNDVTPRFWAQSLSFQPLTWRVDEGPLHLAPGQTAAYSISATHTIAEVEIDRGGTLTVTDRDSSLRKTLPIKADTSALSPRAVPNASLRFWDVHAGSPTWWRLSRSGAPAGHARAVTAFGRRGVELIVDSDLAWARKNELQFCLAIPSCWAETKAHALSFSDLDASDDHRVELVVDFASRDRPIAVWAIPPRDANRPPFGELYGVMLSFGSKDVMVLLGSDAGSGVLPNGTPFESMPGAADAWGRYEIDLPRLRDRYAPDVYPRTLPMVRLPLLDIPLIGVSLRYVYSTRSTERRAVTFGPIDDPITGRDDRDEIMKELDAHPGEVDLWRARYEWDFGNHDRAREHIARARAAEKHPEIELRAAELARFFDEPEQARKAYENILARAPIPAHLGLGWLDLAARNPAVARDHFQAAADLLARERQLDGEEELLRLNALVGIAISRASLGDCKGAIASIRELPEVEQRRHLAGGAPEVLACARSEGALP